MQIGVVLARTLVASSGVVCVLATCVWIGSCWRPGQLNFDARVGDRTYVVAGGAADPKIDLQDGRRWLGVTAGHRRFVIPPGLRGSAPPAGTIDRFVVQAPAQLVVLSLAAVPTIWIVRRNRRRRRRGFQVELPPCADAAAA